MKYPSDPTLAQQEAEERKAPISDELPFAFGVRADESIWSSYGKVAPGFKHCAGDINWPLWAVEDLKRRLEEASALRSQLASALSSERRLREVAEDAGELLRLVGTTWTDESDAHKKAHRVADRIIEALTAPAACPDLVLVGRESGAGRQEILLAVNRSCSCGGKGMDDPGACPACEVWHRLFGDAVQKQVTEAGLKGGGE